MSAGLFECRHCKTTWRDALLKRGDAWKAFAEHMSGCTHCTGGNYEECVIGEPLQSAAEGR